MKGDGCPSCGGQNMAADKAAGLSSSGRRDDSDMDTAGTKTAPRHATASFDHPFFLGEDNRRLVRGLRSPPITLLTTTT